VHWNTGTLADELIMGGFVRVLEPSPPTDVINQNSSKPGMTAYYVTEQEHELWSILEKQATAPFI
jgi:hypothetical protein